MPLVKRIVRGISAALRDGSGERGAGRARRPREAERELRRRLVAALGDAALLRDGLPELVLTAGFVLIAG